MLVAVKSHQEKNVFQNVNLWVKTLNPKTRNASCYTTRRLLSSRDRQDCTVSLSQCVKSGGGSGIIIFSFSHMRNEKQ